MKRKQTATLPETDYVANGTNYGDQKEMTASYNTVVISRSKVHNPVTARIYMGRSASASRVYATIWVSGPGDRFYSGSGYADGSGYHKPSAALDVAITNAGIELAHHIDGVGELAIEDALVAITKALGYSGKVTILRN